MKEPVYCSFCCKSDQQVAFMVAGSVRVLICDECVEGCAAVIVKKRRELANAVDAARCANCVPSPLSVGLRFAAHFLNEAEHG